MGSDLSYAPDGKAPRFLVQAVCDPKSTYLDRIQIIKGWVGEDRAAQEKIFNVAHSDNRQTDDDGAVAPVGDTVDREKATYEISIGDPELTVVWEDPEFNAKQRAFYCARLLEIPTPRHSLYDAVAMLTNDPEWYASVIQERAFSSPIWYTRSSTTNEVSDNNDRRGPLKKLCGLFGDSND